MDAIKQKQKNWLLHILQSTGLRPSQLAQHAGLSTTTLTRFLNAEEHKSALSPQTVSAIQNAVLALAASIPDIDGQHLMLTQMPDAEQDTVKGDVAPYAEENIAHQADKHMQVLLRTALEEDAARSLWVVKSRALEGRGYIEGDIVCIQPVVEPRNGDIVCVHVYDWGHMQARTALRFYSPPFLLASESGVMHHPLALKDQDVTLLGVVLFSYRPRRVWG